MKDNTTQNDKIYLGMTIKNSESESALQTSEEIEAFEKTVGGGLEENNPLYPIQDSILDSILGATAHISLEESEETKTRTEKNKTQDGKLALRMDEASFQENHNSEQNNYSIYYQKRRYQFLGKLGAGGMGSVYEVLDLNLKRRIAVKVAHSQLSDQEEQMRQFLTEAQITSQLQHPNIIPVHEIGSNEKGEIFFSMKKIQGTPLSKIIKGLRDPQLCVFHTENELIRYFRKVCDAIAFAHSHRVIHRDLKPDNIMIGKFGEVLVMDWGLAKLLESKKNVEESGLFEKGTSKSPSKGIKIVDPKSGTDSLGGGISGTPFYMSPEQALGEVEQIRETSDIYSLGAILFELFAYQPPVTGGSLQDVLVNVAHGNILQVTELKKDISLELAAIIHKCLSLKPEDRYRTVADLSQDVDRYLDELPVSCYQGTRVFRVKRFIKRRPAVFSYLVTVFSFGILLLSLGNYFSFRINAKNKTLAEKNNAIIEANEVAIRLKKEKIGRMAKQASAYQLFTEAVQLMRYHADRQEILRLLEKALKIDDSFYPAAFEIAVWYQNEFEGKKAVEYFRIAHNIYFREKKEIDLKTQFHIALTYLWILGNKEKAVAALNKIQRSKKEGPKNPYRLMTQAYLMAFKGKVQKAFSIATEARKKASHLWETHATIADISSIGIDQPSICKLNEWVPHKENGNSKNSLEFQKLITSWNKVIELNPNSIHAYLRRGEMYQAVAEKTLTTENLKDSKSVLEKCQQDYLEVKKRNNPYGYFSFIKLLLTQKKHKEALKVYQNFQKKFPSHFLLLKLQKEFPKEKDYNFKNKDK